MNRLTLRHDMAYNPVIMKNHSPTFNINLGNFETAQARMDAYKAAAKKEGLQSVGAWVKKHLDKIAGYKK